MSSILDSKGSKETIQKVEPTSSTRTSQETEQSQGKRSQTNESSDKPPPTKKRK